MRRSTHLRWRSRLDEKRIITKEIVDVELLACNDIIVAVRSPSKTRRHMYLHFDRVNGRVWYFPPYDSEGQKLGGRRGIGLSFSSEEQIPVGIHGELI